MPVPKEKRDYSAEYKRRKANGWVRPPRDHHAEYESRKAAGYKPNYAEIYQKEKESGKIAEKNAKRKSWSLVIPNEEVDAFMDVLNLFSCKSPSEFMRKIIRKEFLVFTREDLEQWNKRNN